MGMSIGDTVASLWLSGARCLLLQVPQGSHLCSFNFLGRCSILHLQTSPWKESRATSESRRVVPGVASHLENKHIRECLYLYSLWFQRHRHLSIFETSFGRPWTQLSLIGSLLWNWSWSSCLPGEGSRHTIDDAPSVGRSEQPRNLRS